MDPLQKWEPALISRSAQTTSAAASQKGTGASQPFSSEQLFSELSARADSIAHAPLPEGPLQQEYRKEKSLQEQRWERLGFSQRKKAFLGHLRRRHHDHMAPYPVERDTRVSPSGDRAQNLFRCKCRYCQGHGSTIAEITGERNGAPNPSFWEMLVQGLSGLTLSLGANRPGLLPEGAQQQQQQEPEEKCQLEGQEESKRMFQRLLKQWLEEN
uniref:Protein FAM156A/FAM156B-like n=2 Tax=Castor canadensis TaxID=51338 RepID=A0A250XWD5_CASCN|nr:protein FAM156A/FAM156B-like [Castor canadensis]